MTIKPRSFESIAANAPIDYRAWAEQFKLEVCERKIHCADVVSDDDIETMRLQTELHPELATELGHCLINIVSQFEKNDSLNETLARIAEVLIKAGANVNVKEPEQERTCAMLTASADRADILELLHQHGARFNVMDKRGRTLADVRMQGIRNQYSQACLAVIDRALRAEWAASMVAIEPGGP